jgi:hypothetical protein
MALLLDGQRLTPQSRTERLLQAVTFDTVIKCAPIASIAGVPLAIVAAKDYTVGYASYLGVPGEFVKADPTAALVPFAAITVLLLIGLIALHEVDHLGFTEALKSFGRFARFWIVLVAVSLYTGYGLSGGAEELATSALSVGLLWVLLWWVVPLLFLLLRRVFSVFSWVEWLIVRIARMSTAGAATSRHLEIYE